jgi:hypothetical protein
VFGGGPDPEPHAAQDRDAQQGLDHPERAWEPGNVCAARDSRGAVEDDDADERAEADGDDDPLEIADARVAPATAVEAEVDVDDGAGRKEQPHDRRERRDGEGAAHPVEAERQREV